MTVERSGRHHLTQWSKVALPVTGHIDTCAPDIICTDNLASLLWYTCQEEHESNNKGTSDKSKLGNILQIKLKRTEKVFLNFKIKQMNMFSVHYTSD